MLLHVYNIRLHLLQCSCAWCLGQLLIMFKLQIRGTSIAIKHKPCFENEHKTPLREYAFGSRPIHSSNGPFHEKTAIIVYASTSGINKTIRANHFYSICQISIFINCHVQLEDRFVVEIWFSRDLKWRKQILDINGHY